MASSFQSSESYNIKSGEIFLTPTGDLTILCTLCEKKCYDFFDYTDHVGSEHLPIIEVEFFSDSDHSKSAQEDLEGFDFIQNEGAENNSNDFENEKPVLAEELSYGTNTCEQLNKIGAQTVKKRIQHDFDELNNLYKCTICDFSCKLYKNLVGHVKRHSEHKPNQCDECEKAFYTRFELKTHKRSHSGERPFLCNECGQCFITSGKLSDHMKRHTNEKNYQCKVCNRKFFNTQNLKRHLAVHSNERCYECQMCQASFKRLTALTNHRKLHENKKEYRCEMCPARFNQRPGLYSHLRSMHTVSQASPKVIEEQIEVVL